MISKTCKFSTERLYVAQWHSISADDWINQDLAQVITALLTPPVTQALPKEWQGDYTIERANEWIKDRDQEGVTLLVIERSSQTPIGLMILFESGDARLGRTINLGYLLSESMWGRGFASELVRGFVQWCKTVEIVSIVAGVDCNNISSQRVLEKNGFVNQGNTKDNPELLLFKCQP